MGNDKALQDRQISEQRQIEAKLDLAEANLAHEYWKGSATSSKKPDEPRVFYVQTTWTTTSFITSTTTETTALTTTTDTSTTFTRTSVTRTTITTTMPSTTTVPTTITITTVTMTTTKPPKTTVTNFLSGELTFQNR